MVKVNILIQILLSRYYWLYILAIYIIAILKLILGIGRQGDFLYKLFNLLKPSI